MMQLYWVATDERCEDWLIVAGDAREAAHLLENMVDFDTGDVAAAAVLESTIRTLDGDFESLAQGRPNERTKDSQH